MKKTTLISFFAVLTVLCGCGIKPDDVDPPQGHENDRFPQVYPNPSDPKAP